MPIPDLDWTIIASAIAGALAVILILLLRSRSERAAGVLHAEETSYDDPSIGYEWIAGPRYWGKLFFILFIAVGIGLAWFLIEDVRELLGRFYQILIGVAGLFITMLANAFKRYRYQITDRGLLRSQIGSKGDPKLLFTWRRLVWIKPDNSGFRYYLKPEKSLEIQSGISLLAGGGRVEAGDRAMIVNSIVMGREIPTSPPEQNSGYSEVAQ